LQIGKDIFFCEKMPKNMEYLSNFHYVKSPKDFHEHLKFVQSGHPASRPKTGFSPFSYLISFACHLLFQFSISADLHLSSKPCLQ
jgi:hypothetical protein